MQQAALTKDELYYTDVPLGEIFRRTREHYGQTIPDIERALRIRAVQIAAIESGQVEKLPGRVYAIGFIRSYAEYLGLDGDRMVHLFKIQGAGKTVEPELTFPVAASESKIPPVWLVAASISVAILLSLGWLTLAGSDRTFVEAVPPVPKAMKSDGMRDAYGPPAPQNKVNEIAETPSKGIVLDITHSTWVEIRDKSGKALVSQVLNAGDQYYVPDRPDLMMSLGNAGGVSLRVDGEPLAPVGNLGDVLRNIPLDARELRDLYGTSPD